MADEKQNKTLLTPRQIGFGVGAEAAIRAARCFVENMHERKLLVKIDFQNAFNTKIKNGCLDLYGKV